MTIPVQAFGEIQPGDLQPGSVYKIRNDWALLVSYENRSARDLLMLSGEEAGWLVNINAGMRRCFGIIPPFTWFPTVEAVSSTVEKGRRTCTLMLAPNGLVIIGAKLNNFGDPEYYAFRLNGMVDRDYQPYGAEQRYADWAVELQHTDRPFQSLGRLFTVSETQNR
jgi:hypothetical protein